jgi:N-carbamoyl-L-amino-acid hydrolase
MDVNGHRLRDDLMANAEFGALDVNGQGRTVLTGSEPNRAARDYLCSRFEDVRMTVRVDRVGNIAGRWVPSSADETADPVATGSHLDSVPAGGIFDGPLGVYAGLEAVRSLKE